MIKAQAVAAATAKPGMKLPKTSLNTPTTRGDRNMPKLLTEKITPQTIASFSGVMPGSPMGSDKEMGLYR